MESSGSSTPGSMSTRSASGPWRPNIWALGGMPKKNVDIPVTAVFLFLYILGAASHMAIFQYNKRRGHKFLFNAMIFGFCMARVVTCILRIASISLPQNIRLALAAQIFVAAGILVVFIVNLIWSQRILRAHHPIGWHSSVRYFFIALYVVIGLTLAVLITAVVQSYYTLRPRTRSIDRSMQLYGATLFAIVSFLPMPIMALALTLSRASKLKIEKFGHGRHRTKIAILIAGSTLSCLGAAFRAGTSWRHPVPLVESEPTYFHRGWFYFMNFGIEVIIVFFYAIMRVDLRFWVPDGARGSGSYRIAKTTGTQISGLGSRAGSAEGLEKKSSEEV